MKSEIIVVVVMVALAIGGLVYLEINSRRNKRQEEEQTQSVDID
jgi:flagellar basal body-associated protein FliL